MALDPAQLAALAALTDDDLAREGTDTAAGEGAPAATWETLRDIVAEVTGVEEDTLTRATSLADLDIDTLQRYMIATRAERELHHGVIDDAIEGAATLGDLADCFLSA